MNTDTQSPTRWCENVIVADGDTIDRIAFDLTVNFERMLGRRVEKADLAQWIDCVALDGGLRPGEHETQVVFTHSPNHDALENFQPGRYDDIDGTAFRDNLGEFRLNAYQVEPMVTADSFLADIVANACAREEVKRIVIIPDETREELLDELRNILRRTDPDRHITLLTMQPLRGGNFRQELLGYSLMQALGIRGDELK